MGANDRSNGVHRPRLELHRPDGEIWRFQRCVHVGAGTNADVEWVLPGT